MSILTAHPTTAATTSPRPTTTTTATTTKRAFPTSMSQTGSSEGSAVLPAITALHPATARLQRLPTPPRSPGLAPLGKQLTLIEPPMTGQVRFLILDCPTDSTLPFYLAELKRYNVTDVVRCCEPTYSAETMQSKQIEVHDWAFRDGAVPPSNIIKNWLQLVDSRIVRRSRNSSPSGSEEEDESTVAPTIAVHCVAGLGRAPILVAIALVELGMANLDTVEFIRRRRRGCFNSNQIQYIDGYKRGKVLKHALGNGSGGGHGAGGGGHGGSSNGSVLGAGSSMKSGFSKMFRLKA